MQLGAAGVAQRLVKPDFDNADDVDDAIAEHVVHVREQIRHIKGLLQHLDHHGFGDDLAVHDNAVAITQDARDGQVAALHMANVGCVCCHLAHNSLIRFLAASIDAGLMLNSLTPISMNRGISSRSAAASPQMPTQMPARCAASQVISMARMTAG